MPFSRFVFLRALCAYTAILLVTTTVAHSRLGETVAEIEEDHIPGLKDDLPER